ncbi:hypothetical protein [Photobacterium sp. DNB22_13_2]
MEYFPEHFKDWKKSLMQGQTTIAVLQRIGEILRATHKVSCHESIEQDLFKSDSNFHELRLAPYFEYMIAKCRRLYAYSASLCSDVASTKCCLVHGDISPNNIFVSGEEVQLDVGWDHLKDKSRRFRRLILACINRTDQANLFMVPINIGLSYQAI